MHGIYVHMHLIGCFQPKHFNECSYSKAYPTSCTDFYPDKLTFLSSQIKSQGSYSKNTCMTMPWAAGALTPECTRTRSSPDRGNAHAALAKGHFRQTKKLKGTWTFQGFE